MKIGITGATGFIGTEVARLARTLGHETIAFSRQPRPLPHFTECREFRTSASPDLSGLDALVHLAGESILGLWTAEKKRRILESRVAGTRALAEALNTQSGAPGIFVSGSAIGIYGDTGDHCVDESSPAGKGFLADVARKWEAEALQATTARTTLLRTGFVLGRTGGAMRLIAPAFKLGLGGPLGSGRQWMSCVHVEDVAGIILHAVETEGLHGPLNAVLPEPVRNADFTRAVGRAVHRPAFLPAPAFAIKAALGELSHLLLDSQRVVPTATLASGYAFKHATLASAVEASV